MLKSSKRFTLSTESVNSHGFRVLTSGINLSHFYTNPLMLWMHNRPLRGTKEEVLPLGYWDDIQVKDRQISAVPVFDDQDTFAMAIYHKVEHGTLRMASPGLTPLIWNQAAEIPLLAQSLLKEASIVDIGSNAEALAATLYDRQDNVIQLADSLGKTALSLPADKTWEELHLAGELEKLKAENPALFRLKFKEQFGRDYTEPATAKAARTSSQLAQREKEEIAFMAKLAQKSWEELWRAGELTLLQLKNPILYAQKYQEQFGRMPSRQS